MSAPIKILIVDDRAENLIALEASLRQPGLVILNARSGPEALETLLTHEIALTILDVQMPEMDGFELAELMRGAERTRNVPIIFLTAGALEQERVFRGYETGAVDFLFKPYDPLVLASKVRVFVELERQRQELHEALRFRDLFLGILGHDLRNPLAAIISGSEMLEIGAKDDKQRTIATRVVNAGVRMGQMIEEILDFTRFRIGGGIPLNKGEHDLSALAATILDELRLVGGTPPMALESAGDAQLVCDGQRILQVLSNLLGNAIQHGTPGEPIQLRIDGSDKSALIIEVRNRGAILPALLPFIFDPFQRIGVPPGQGRRGLGLGLYIAQQIVLAHGGVIRVETSGDTAFIVHLPR